MHKLVKKHGHLLIYEITTGARGGWGGGWRLSGDQEGDVLIPGLCILQIKVCAANKSSTFTQLLWQHTECMQSCAQSHVDARETLSEISSKSAVRRAGLTSFIAVLLSHHSCNQSPSLWTKENNSRGEFPCWWRWCCGAAETSDQSRGDNERSSWRPYRTSVKRSSVGAAFLCIVLLFANHCFSLHRT